MEELFQQFAGWIALIVEATAAVLIAVGALETLASLVEVGWRAPLSEKKKIWVHFARWLVLALEFELAADIVRTAISPTWDDVGQLAAIAGVRTFLNYFLERDMERVTAAEGA